MLTVNLSPHESFVDLPENSEVKEATYILFANIKNSPKLHKSLMKGEVEAALLKPSMIADIFQVIVATNRAVRAKKYNRMSTKSIYTEIVYNLSPYKQISEALTTFGFSASYEITLAVVLSGQESEQIDKLKKQIDGDIITIDHLKDFQNEANIRKFYKISKDEPYDDTILNCILGRMACKEFPIV